MNSVRAIQLFEQLAQQHRLAIIRLLAARPERGLSAGAIAEALEVPASSLSFHLTQLRLAGLIRQERRSRSLIYSAKPKALDGLIAYLIENCRDSSRSSAGIVEKRSGAAVSRSPSG